MCLIHQFCRHLILAERLLPLDRGSISVSSSIRVATARKLRSSPILQRPRWRPRGPAGIAAVERLLACAFLSPLRYLLARLVRARDASIDYGIGWTLLVGTLAAGKAGDRHLPPSARASNVRIACIRLAHTPRGFARLFRHNRKLLGGSFGVPTVPFLAAVP